MAELLKTITLKFTKSGSPDVTGYALYVEEVPGAVTHDSQRFDLGNPADVNGVVSVELQNLEGMSTKDGVFNLGVAAVDSAGNESTLLMDGLQNVAIDFKAPDPPTSGHIERL